jgi:hypothetical protein
MINWYYEQMYISCGFENEEDKCSQNVTIVNTDTRHFRLFKWAIDKAMYYLFNGDYQNTVKFLDIADAYFSAATYG